MRKHLGLLFIGYLLGILIYSFVNFNELQGGTELYWSGFLGVFVLYLTVFSNSFFNNIIPFKKLPGLRILTGIVWNSILSFFIVVMTLKMFNGMYQNDILEEQQSDLYIKLGILLFCASLLYNIIYFALFSYHNYVHGQVMELQLERKQTELQLMTLKAQLSPHFLFNSINSLTALFQKDVAKAETFIRALAGSYQYTLNNYRITLITLEKELSFVSAYLFLIKTRFENGVVVKIDLDEHILQQKIPPLTLQLLIENAVKHNVFDIKRPLTVTVFSEGDKLIVTNTKTEKKERLDSTKIGLKNIISRYQLLTDRKVEIINEEDFTVKIPIIK